MCFVFQAILPPFLCVVCVPVAVAGEKPNIIDPPQSVNISLNGIASFSCTGFAEFIRWNVNGNPLDNRAGFKQITVLLNQTQSLRRSTLSVVASLQNNNTKIKCLSFNLSPLTFTNSEPAVLHIQGLLKSVVDLNITYINSTTVLISWSPPFTLEGVPILGYNVTIFTISRENETMLVEDTTLLYSIDHPENSFTVIVVPINEVGAGQPALISIELPLPSPVIYASAIVPDIVRLSVFVLSTTQSSTTSTTLPVNNGTTAQLLSIVVLVGIISPVVAVIVLVLLTSFIVMTCWIKRHSKGKVTPADVQDVIITANNPVYEMKMKRIDLCDNSAYGVIP